MVDRKEWAVPESRSTKKKKNRKAYTVPGMISELENIECTRNSVGKYRRKYALTAKQKLILKQFDMDEKYIDRSIGEFSY